MRTSFGIALLVALFVATSGAWAGNVTVLNNNFALPSEANGATSAGITDWTYFQTGVYNPTGTTAFPGGVPNGEVQVGWANAGGDFYQVLSGTGDDLAANTTYTLTVDVGLQNIEGLTISPIVDLYAGTTLMGSLTLSSPGGSIPTSGNWDLWTLTVNSANYGGEVGEPLEIYLASATTQTDFANVSLNATSNVPEPAMFMLVGVGLLGLVTRRRFAQ